MKSKIFPNRNQAQGRHLKCVKKIPYVAWIFNKLFRKQHFSPFSLFIINTQRNDSSGRKIQSYKCPQVEYIYYNKWKCSFFQCYMFHMYVGVRAGGGIGDEIEDPAGDEFEVERVIFDITFFFFVIVILLAIIQGESHTEFVF